MFRDSSPDDKNKTLISGLEGNNFPDSIAFGHEIFSELSQLRDALEGAHLNKPIGIEQFEMLEAELQNQGILSRIDPDIPCLASLANQEATFWRWRAQRYCASRVNVSFEVDVPRYIVQRSLEVLAALDEFGLSEEGSTWKFSFRSKKSLLQELRYLESFASYINGAYDRSTNRYQRGCNLILQVLAHAPQWRGQSTVVVTLPVTKDEFINSIKPYKFGKRVRT